MPPRSYIEAMDLPIVLYILYTMVSAQQTNLLPKNASQKDAIFAQKVYRIYVTTSQYLSSNGCAITMVYIYTVWPEILAGNLFWRIGGFESNPPIFHPPKTSQCDVSLLRSHSLST